jgi:tripartite-type tricarboxylate transporter receptor subunit TctC
LSCIKLRALRACASFLLLATASLMVGAQQWPSRPITIVVGFAAGGPTDIVARTVAKALGEELGQPVIVENKPGAGATVAAGQVASGPADGYTLLLVVPGLTGSESLFPTRKYDLAKDFAHVSLVGTSPNWLLTSVDSPFKTIQDVARLAAAQPGKFSYAHGGSGGISHLSAEWLKTLKNLDIVQIAYRGNGPALLDVAAGRVELLFDQPISSESFVTSGKLRVLAVTSATRLRAYPNVPTMVEGGYPDFVVDVWYGLSLRAGTPEPIVKAMNAAIAKAVARADVKESLSRSGVTAASSSTKDFEARVKSEIERWRGVITKNNITLQ